MAFIFSYILPIYHSLVFYSTTAVPLWAYAAGISLYLIINGNSITNLSFQASLHSIAVSTINKWTNTGIYEQASLLKNITGILKKEQ